MADLPTISDPTGKTLKEQYVPLEKRGSQNIDWKPFIYDTVKFFVVTKLSALAGYFVGKSMIAKNIKIGRLHLTPQWGAIIGGTVGGFYELYHHWHKTEGKHLGVESISSDLTTALDSAPLERAGKKEQAIIDDLKKLEEKLAQPKSHLEKITTRREEAAPETGIGA